jgi:hypothetical protein
MFPVVFDVAIIIDDINAAGEKAERKEAGEQQEVDICIKKFLGEE